MDQIKILTLLENQVSQNKTLAAAHGLSFYIRRGDVSIMFDFGPGREAWENGRKMNVPFDEIEYGVFSHSHYDHSCGFLWAEEYGFNAAAVCGEEKEFFRPKYSLTQERKGETAGDGIKTGLPGEGFGNRYTYMGCGFSAEYLQSHAKKRFVCKDVLELGNGCWAAGNFERQCLWEQIPGKYVREGALGMEPDRFTDEICLVFALPGRNKGLLLVAGCSHPGIANMVWTVKKRWSMPVKMVLGGLHLAKAGERQMEKTAAALKEAGVEAMAANHCSGDSIREIMEARGIRSFSLKTGDYWCL